MSLVNPVRNLGLSTTNIDWAAQFYCMNVKECFAGLIVPGQNLQLSLFESFRISILLPGS